MPRDTEEIITAADNLGEVLRPNWDMLSDSWHSFGCQEIEAFSALFSALGLDTLAFTCVYDHAGEDQDGDSHVYLRGIDYDTARRLWEEEG